MSDIRNLLKTQTVQATTGQDLQTVGGRVFLDGNAISALRDLDAIVQAWRGVHAPAYGQPIPTTGTLHTHAMTGSDLENVVDVSSGVLKVQAVSLTNGGPAPILWDVYVGGVRLNENTLAADPGASGVYAVPGSLFIDENTPLQVKVASGTPTDGTVDVSSITVAF